MSEKFSVTSAVRRLILAVGRGRISQSDDSGKIQTVQVKLNPKETPDLRRVAEYAFASWPPDGCDAIAVFLSGDRSNGVVIATHDLKSRFKLGNKGEFALFDNSGADGVPGRWIWFKLGMTPIIEIEAAGTPIVVNNAKKVTVNAGTDGVVLNTTGNVVFNMGGKDLTVAGAGTVKLDNPVSVILGPAGKKVVVDGDPVSGGAVHATQNVVKA